MISRSIYDDICNLGFSKEEIKNFRMRSASEQEEVMLRKRVNKLLRLPLVLSVLFVLYSIGLCISMKVDSIGLYISVIVFGISLLCIVYVIPRSNLIRKINNGIYVIEAKVVSKDGVRYNRRSIEYNRTVIYVMTLASTITSYSNRYCTGRDEYSANIGDTINIYVRRDSDGNYPIFLPKLRSTYVGKYSKHFND